MVGMKKNKSLHTFTMEAAFDHEDEGTAVSSAASVVGVMANANSKFPGVVTAHQLGRSLDVILNTRGFDKEKTLLTTSLSGDDVNRDFEDELRQIYGQNFNIGGVAGFPFGGCSAFGAMGHHIPTNGQCLIVYGPHVGIDYDGVIGKVNRRGHSGSGTCCNASIAALAYVKAVKNGTKIHSPDASDPIDAQQVFVDSALLEHADRLLSASDPMVELPHAVYDCQEALMKRIMDKCLPGDFPKDTPIALLGGVQVNTPEGTPEYFLPKKFTLCNSKGEVVEDLLEELMEEGHKDLKKVLRDKKIAEKTAAAKADIVDVPIVY